jgi:hypothetical protein
MFRQVWDGRISGAHISRPGSGTTPAGNRRSAGHRRHYLLRRHAFRRVRAGRSAKAYVSGAPIDYSSPFGNKSHNIPVEEHRCRILDQVMGSDMKSQKIPYFQIKIDRDTATSRFHVWAIHSVCVDGPRHLLASSRQDGRWLEDQLSKGCRRLRAEQASSGTGQGERPGAQTGCSLAVNAHQFVRNVAQCLIDDIILDQGE